MTGPGDLTTVVRSHVHDSLAALARLPWSAARLAEWAADLHGSLERGARVLVVGNGGSAALAQHFTSELVGRFQHDRRLGDALVVLRNGDRSVRRLKGPTRPLVPEADRAAVLRALGCADAVAVFDDDTPERTLGVLRPQIFCKGGDYAGVRTLAAWGGRLVLLPRVEGRSTTRLVELAQRSAS